MRRKPHHSDAASHEQPHDPLNAFPCQGNNCADQRKREPEPPHSSDPPPVHRVSSSWLSTSERGGRFGLGDMCHRCGVAGMIVLPGGEVRGKQGFSPLLRQRARSRVAFAREGESACRCGAGRRSLGTALQGMFPNAPRPVVTARAVSPSLSANGAGFSRSAAVHHPLTAVSGSGWSLSARTFRPCLFGDGVCCLTGPSAREGATPFPALMKFKAGSGSALPAVISLQRGTRIWYPLC